MKTLTAGNGLVDLLRQAKELAEIRDESGALVGFFAPVGVEGAHLYAQTAAQVDPQEMAHRKEPGRRSHTTPEVLAHLRSLERS